MASVFRVWSYLYLIVDCLSVVYAACTFPTAFVNVWTTSSRGTWTVTISQISNFQTVMSSGSTTLYTMDCDQTYNGNYILKSVETFSSQNVYTCLSLTSVSSFKYTFSLLTTSNEVSTGVYERVVLKSSTVSDGSEICNDTSSLTPERTHVALLNGSETSGKTACPSDLQSTYTYIGTTCNSTGIDVCTDTNKVVVDTSSCTQYTMYSSGGVLDCIYHTTSGSNTYLTLYNEDSSPDGSTYYQFSCMMFSKTETYVYATVNPSECLSTQTTTTAPSTGYVTAWLELTTSSCYPVAAEDNTRTTLIIVVVLLAVLFIVEVIIGVCLIKRVMRRKKQTKKRHGARNNLIYQSDEKA